jgi:hypothetical protein
MFIRNCTFGFKCAVEWDGLSETSDSSVRFCLDCQREVYFCKTTEQLADAIRLNRCVAVRLESGARQSMPTLGVPLAFKAEAQ